MKICFDVNAVVYLFADEGFGFGATVAYDVATIRKHEVMLPTSTLADISYILHRRGIQGEELDRCIGFLFELFDVVDVNASDAQRAFHNDMRDFEDAIIAESAARHGADLILTQNVKDFSASPVPAMSLEDFCRIYTPEGYEYSEVMP